MDFCRIKGKKLVKDGFKKGDLVFVSGTKLLPYKESDPYVQRIYMICERVAKAGYVDHRNMYLVDPVSLIKCDEEEQEKFTALLAGQIEEEEDAADHKLMDKIVAQCIEAGQDVSTD